MRAGKLINTIIVLRRGPATISDTGKKADAWTPIATVRAQVLSDDAQAFMREQGQSVERAVVFRVRYRDGIAPGDRIIMGTHAFDLVETKEVVRRRVLELRCTGGKP